MNLKKYKEKLLSKNPEFKKEYYSYNLAFEIGQMLLEARTIKGITQKQLARMINTKQSGIARAESGKYLPSLSFLNKIANALKTYLVVKFAFMSEFSAFNKAETVSVNKVFITSESSRSWDEKHLTYSVQSNRRETDSSIHHYA